MRPEYWRNDSAPSRLGRRRESAVLFLISSDRQSCGLARRSLISKSVERHVFLSLHDFEEEESADLEVRMLNIEEQRLLRPRIFDLNDVPNAPMPGAPAHRNYWELSSFSPREWDDMQAAQIGGANAEG